MSAVDEHQDHKVCKIEKNVFGKYASFTALGPRLSILHLRVYVYFVIYVTIFLILGSSNLVMKKEDGGTVFLQNGGTWPKLLRATTQKTIISIYIAVKRQILQ